MEVTGMYCARPRDYHSLGLTRIQFHPPKVTPLTNPAKVTDRDSAPATLTPGHGTTAIKWHGTTATTGAWHNSHNSLGMAQQPGHGTTATTAISQNG